MKNLQQTIMQIGLCVVITVLAAGCAPQNSGLTAQSPVPETHFSEEYIREHAGKVAIETPEVFELAHIAWAISRAENPVDEQTDRDSEYYQRVVDHFTQYKDHELIQLLAQADPFSDYFSFRTNSAAYEFAGDTIQHAGIYSTAWQPDFFTAHLELVQDFAEVSGFCAFYQENLPFYTEQIEKYQKRVPVDEMWAWLETNFPDRFSAYKVLFSPLIRASHNAQAFADNGFSETVVYVAGPDVYASREYDSQVEKALLSRIVFTEIDHNYVGPATNRRYRLVEEAFQDVKIWNASLEDQSYYSPAGTFNEYMTWAVYLLYLYDEYDLATADQAADITIDLMQNGRGFTRFEDFAAKLLEMYQAREEGQLLPDLYPAMLEWAAQQE